MSSRSVSDSSGADGPTSRPTFKTPRPVPVISLDQSFTHKKKGITRFSPPKPPAKSAPPISRVFRHTRKSTSGPQAVSFRERNSSIESPHYNAELHVSYFEQVYTFIFSLISNEISLILPKSKPSLFITIDDTPLNDWCHTILESHTPVPILIPTEHLPSPIWCVIPD